MSVKDCLELMRRFEDVEVTMKKFEDSGDAQVNVSYTRDPTKKSQRNRFSRMQFKPKSQPNHKKSPTKESCIWCQRENHPHDKCPAKDAMCKFCGKQGHFERACLKKKGQVKDKTSRHQHVVDVSPDQDSSDYDDDFNLSVVSINAVNNWESCEVFSPVVFQPKGDGSRSFKITGKVDTSAMVSCMPTSMLPQIGLSKNNLKPSNAIIQGMSGADLQNCGK